MPAMNASAAPTNARPSGAPGHASTATGAALGGPRRAAGAGPSSFDDAMLALLLGAADGPPAEWTAPGEEIPAGASAKPVALPLEGEDATAAEGEDPVAGIATAEAFPLADLAAQWMMLRETPATASTAIAPALEDAGNSPGTGIDRPGVGAVGGAKGSRHALADLSAGIVRDPAEASPSAEPASLAASALPAAAPETAPRPETRKNEFAPLLTQAAQDLREPARLAAPPAPPPADSPTLAAEPGTPAFRDGFTERVTILTRGGRTEAEITMHPADLGPIAVRIRLEDGTASFQFDAPSPETRQAIQDSIAQLGQMLADNGISLGGTHVGQSGDQGADPAAFAGPSRREPEADGEPAPETAPARHARILAPGRVDLFA